MGARAPGGVFGRLQDTAGAARIPGRGQDTAGACRRPGGQVVQSFCKLDKASRNTTLGRLQDTAGAATKIFFFFNRYHPEKPFLRIAISNF